MNMMSEVPCHGMSKRLKLTAWQMFLMSSSTTSNASNGKNQFARKEMQHKKAGKRNEWTMGLHQTSAPQKRGSTMKSGGATPPPMKRKHN
jgi:hypothetical protein